MFPSPSTALDLSLSQVSFIATANSVDPIPSPLRDRFRIIIFPEPRKDDGGALLPAILVDLASERGLDHRWIRPLDAEEQATIISYWNGGSVRLRRIVDAIVRAREGETTRN